ncbi:CHAT domain-containing protein [Aeromonas dhakensis]|uniref:CHAT domain-containing protein n=1 Tax=Aeromonas dhakensis TaxID=196024 RepID=UPI00197E8368|nr:CHAT domain-containing protein [Aeromonas dhakensis]MBW3730720.1 CHAT domain-containing protein [Aeromonas dhakensis]
MKNKFNICYMIINQNEGEKPFLTSSNYLHKISPLLELINNLPISIPELLCQKEERIRIRLSNIYPGRVIHLINSQDDISKYSYLYKVVFVDKLVKIEGKDENILYVTISEGITDNSLFFGSLTVNDLRSFYFSKIKKLDDVYTDLPDTYKHEQINTDITIADSIYTSCNIRTLKSIGVNLNNKASDNEKNNSIVTSINLINKIKNEIATHMNIGPSIPSADYLISDFSIDMKYSIASKEYSKHNLMKSEIPDYELISEAITYAKTKTDIDNHEHNNKYINEYKKEIYLNSLITSIYTSSTLTPEIKIDICNNDLFTLVSDMGKNIRSNKMQNIQKMMKKFSLKVNEKSNTMLDYISTKSNKQIKIISNLPLEWTNIDGLPLMIRHNTSRIFNTPGFIKENLLLNNNEVSIEIKNFKKILVISSFRSGERISNDIKNALNDAVRECSSPEINAYVTELVSQKGAYASDFEPEIIFKSVTNKNELINAMNLFPFALVIFDMHGGHDYDGNGFLVLSEEILNPYELIGIVNIPPIIVLSACDTSPADRNHLNVANAFLCAGAKTVLASTYPILSKDAAIYIKRLYKRLRYYLPERINSLKKSLRWSEFMTGLNRRVYFEYFLQYLIKKYNYSDKTNIIRLNFTINSILESEPSNFLYHITLAIEKTMKLSTGVILDELRNYFVFAECLNYVQIGFPEKILICAEDIHTS